MGDGLEKPDYANSGHLINPAHRTFPAARIRDITSTVWVL